jgi:L-aminopeptidase/D-esterase-like protein
VSRARRSRIIIVIVATDAPLAATSTGAHRARVSLGLGRWVVSRAIHPAICFSHFRLQTPKRAKPEGTPSLVMLPNERIDPLFQGDD